MSTEVMICGTLLPGPLLSRREAIAALASTAALPLISACGRDRAATALGPRFDAKAFNDTVVLGGNVPLDVLAKNVDEYIRTTTS